MLVNTYFAKMVVLNTIFRLNGSEENKGTVLLCEWGAAHYCTAWYNETSKSVSHLHYSSFEQLDQATTQSIFALLAEQADSATRVIICSAFPQAILTPARYYQAEAALIATLYGKSFTPEMTNPINEWLVINSFAFPKGVSDMFIENLEGAVFMHVYTPELKIYNGFPAENQVAVHFTPKHFRVVVKRSGQLQLAQIYYYSAPLDVVYFLLMIFEELLLDKTETYLVLSGLVEASSALYLEIQNYFGNVHFAQPSGMPIEGSEHPAHFFTSISNLAACVS
ncbi:MAG: DUF3822 family protein [Chitinophagaceae bacterium]